MHRPFLRLGSLFAGLGIVLGAFGAHGLERVLDADQLATFETGVRYQMYHALGLLLLAILYAPFKQAKALRRAGQLFTAGILCFSGSIYLLACRELLGLENWTWLGPITPIGGTFFIVGWGLVFWTSFKKIK